MQTDSLSRWMIPCACALAISACGARTGLAVPDASAADVAPPEDVFAAFDGCVAGEFPMIRRSARMLFVIDRSGSMQDALVEGERTSRWEAALSVIESTAPRFESDVDMGLLVYPRTPTSELTLRYLEYCDLFPGGGVNVPPARHNAAAMLRTLIAMAPEGATPTAAAIRRGTQWLTQHAARGMSQSMVLLTDGIPNCNRNLDPATCVCLDPAASCRGSRGGENCLDDSGAVAGLDVARRAGIGTYVIGLDGSIGPEFRDVLDRMAVAGGRALFGERRYYSVQDPATLMRAFEQVQRTVAQCSFVTPSRPDDPDALDIAIRGAHITHDPTRGEGWEWTNRDDGEIAFYGRACALANASSADVRATVRCATP